MPIKRLFINVENALLNQRGHLTSSTRQALQRVHLPISLVSQQAPQDLVKYRGIIPISGVQIALNGALILDVSKTSFKIVGGWSIPFYTSFPLINTLTNSFPEVSIYCFDAKTAYHLHGPSSDLFKTEAPLRELPKRMFDQETYQISLYSDTAVVMRQVLITLKRLPTEDLRIESPSSNQLNIISSNAQLSRSINYILTRDSLSDSECAIFQGATERGWPDLPNAIQIATAKSPLGPNSDTFYFANSTSDNPVADAAQYFNYFSA